MTGALFFWRMDMWKIAVAFVVFAGLALYMLSKGGEIDMGGEKHGGLQPAVLAATPLDTLA
jgi:hypothetical protein